MNKIITLNDGSKLEAGLTGNPANKVIMLPIAKKPVFGEEAETLKMWGVDPELGRHFVEGLSDIFQVLHFDYEAICLPIPSPICSHPGTLHMIFLRIADEMQVNTFSYYGYSWLALAGLQLAIRTKRLDSLIMGGFPPYEGPYQEMLTVTAKTYEQAMQHQQTSASDDNSHYEAHRSPDEFDWDNAKISIDPNQTKQFYTMYQNLMDFDDTKVQDRLLFPKLAFAGEQDSIVYGRNFGDVTVDIIGRLEKKRGSIEAIRVGCPYHARRQHGPYKGHAAPSCTSLDQALVN